MRAINIRGSYVNSIILCKFSISLKLFQSETKFLNNNYDEWKKPDKMSHATCSYSCEPSGKLKSIVQKAD